MADQGFRTGQVEVGLYFPTPSDTPLFCGDQPPDFLKERGIQTGTHYPRLVYQQPAFEGLSFNRCPVAEEVVPRVMSLPMFPSITAEQVEYVCNSIKEFYKGQK